MKRATLALIAGLSCLGSATAKEGPDQYPNGVTTWGAGNGPPAGTAYINMFGVYNGTLRNAHGDRVQGGPEVTAIANAFRVDHFTEKTLLGGRWGWLVIVPVVDQKIEVGNGSRSTTTYADVTIDPLLLSWHRGNAHMVTGLDLNLPVGRYTSGDPTRSIGTNYWSVEPFVATTYLSDNGWELSTKLMYNVKGTNHDYRDAPGTEAMDYASGDDVHLDFLAGKHFGNWGVGLSGYYLKQIENDRIDGRVVAAVPGVWSEGRKGEVFALGPSVNYSAGPGKPVFTLQWQHELKSENRFGGDKLGFNAIIPL